MTTKPASFDWGPDVLPIPDATRSVLREQWARLASHGTWWSGAERVEIAAAASAAVTAGFAEIPPPAIPAVARRAAALVAASAHEIDESTIDQLEREGLNRLAFVEIVGIASRVTAIDTALRGLGASPQPLPAPVAGEPTRRTVAGARQRSSWVPMRGGAGATTALSAVPAENDAQEQLHGALYLSYVEMGDYTIVQDLTRPQLELVAARTSMLNQCFF